MLYIMTSHLDSDSLFSNFVTELGCFLLMMSSARILSYLILEGPTFDA